VSLLAPSDAWRVFAQGAEPRLAFADWQRNAQRFFDTAIEIEDRAATSARVKLNGVTRVVFGRTRDDGDLRDALAVESARGNGLYDLAERRCPSMWLVEREGASDRNALLLAAVIASVSLGPILGGDALFGVRTAREKLEALAAPYR
jgi:hypothetical protein